MRPVPHLPHVPYVAPTWMYVLMWAIGIINVGIYIWLAWLGIAAIRRGE